jgi:hypothetical protein
VTDWDTRLAVTVNTQVITPIESINPQFQTAFRVQHSLEQDNVGFVRQPFTFTFTMTVRALGESGQANGVATLTKMALEGTEFSVSVVRAEGSPGDQWAFQETVFNRCFITSAQPSSVTLQDSPMATFNAICLQYTLTDRASTVTTNVPG